MFNHAKITKILFPVLALMLFLANDSISLAQRCYTQQYSDNYYNSNPLSLSKKNEVEQLVEEKGYLLQQQSTSPIIIPVVVHIIYNSSAENISNAQINSQIEALNRDYRKLNTDVENTPELFYNRAADCNIEFRLAIYDPQGNPTTGITRTETDRIAFYPSDDAMKFSSRGDHGIWDRERYLNIWVCDIGIDGVLGYSSCPVWDPSTDGVVIDYEGFGTMGDS